MEFKRTGDGRLKISIAEREVQKNEVDTTIFRVTI
ncbi:MAG: hypothetical protein K0S33_745 [Bacteroidetes bacterium]|jgi:hypothetical protein|nr:hypothetical protein [Bacteroidota bacterium]